MENQLAVFIIRLIFEGCAAFLAIMLWSKTSAGAWMAILGGLVLNYAGVVYNLLLNLNIIFVDKLLLFNIPLTSVIFAVAPSVLFSIGLFMMIIKSK